MSASDSTNSQNATIYKTAYEVIAATIKSHHPRGKFIKAIHFVPRRHEGVLTIRVFFIPLRTREEVEPDTVIIDVLDIS